jgi:dCMP deaminase
MDSNHRRLGTAQGSVEEAVNHRVPWDDYFLHVADSVALRADCTRRKVGAVLVSPQHKILSTGYNGSPPGEPGCLSDGACPRGRHYRSLYKGGSPADGTAITFGSTCGGCGQPWPCAMSVQPNSSYDTGPGSCIAIHAEANALLWAGQSAQGATMYITDEPCQGCKKLMAGAGVKRASWFGGSVILVRAEKESALHRLLQRARRPGPRG